MQSTALSSAPVTSWWYGQGRAVEVVRRLESLHGLSPSPGPAGVVTARRDELIVTFVEGLKTPLPQPWQPAGREARIPWEAVDPGNPPHPEHPVYLVVFGATSDGALIGLNLATFSRIRIQGDPATTTAMVSRWVLELLATHPAITVGITDDAWRGPRTNRVQPVTPGHVPDVDVLVCGGALTYAERAQIVAAATSPILLDLGQDAAVSTVWAITCGPDRLGQISRGPSSKPLTVTLIVPSAEVIDRCTDLLVSSPSDRQTSGAASSAADLTGAGTLTGEGTDLATVDDDAEDPGFDPDTSDPRLEIPESAPPDTANPDGAGPPAAEAIDFFAPAAADHQEPADDEPGTGGETHWPATEYGQHGADSSAAARIAAAAPAVADTGDNGEPTSLPVPVIAPIWNRILGQAILRPPHTTQQPGPREKRLNELTVFLQHNPWASSADIMRAVYGGAASEKTITQQMSMLRARLGVVRPGGPKALPPMSDGAYHLENAVRSDWMEFERLVEILVEATPTPNLVGAMGLVTGPPLGGIPPKEWPWTKDLREELRDRVPAAAVVLAGRQHRAKRFGAALETARKGLWYDSARQDLWEVALQAALDGHDKDAFRELRKQFLNTIAGPDRDPAVFDLTARAG